MKANQQKEQRQVTRILADKTEGLNNTQVEERKLAGKTNAVNFSTSITYKKIIIDNVCSFFNLLCLLCFIALVIFQTDKTSISSFFFIVIYVANSILAIINEIKAKKTIEKLSLIKAPTCDVIRDGKQVTIDIKEIVLDDIIVLKQGMQIPADLILIDGGVEVDESVLTGESLSLTKKVGDSLLSGSFVLSGKCYARAEKVGEEAYLQTLTKKSKKFKRTNSELLRTLKLIIKYVSILIVPVAILSGIINYNHFKVAVESKYILGETVGRTTAVIVGMIPAGMFLLTTIALSAGVIRLGKNNTHAQDMYSLETLARVDTLCLDKTGTITDGKLKVVNTYELVPNDYNLILSSIEKALGDSNQTAQAINEYFSSDTELKAIYKLPFNSARKLSAVSFENGENYVLGAPEFVLKSIPENVTKIIEKCTNDGHRVILLAKTDSVITEENFTNLTPILLIEFEDNIRPEAIETIKWFMENDVNIKVISGDNEKTVAQIAKRAGIKNAESCVSLAGLSEEQVIEIADKYTVFGRVTPEQKAILVKQLKKLGKTVAMTGDGVNDILAMKEADCSITVSSGSSATRSLAHIVLLDDNFNSIPKVVKEGRRVINNIQMSSSLYLMKTIFTTIMAIASIIFGSTYPFTTGDMIMLEMIIIGLPSVVLSLQPNSARVKGKFINGALTNTLPGAFVLIFNVFVAALAIKFFGFTGVENTVRVFALTFGGLAFLAVLCTPFDKLRSALVAFSTVVLLIWAMFVCSTPFFNLTKLTFANNLYEILLILGLFIIDIPIAYFLRKLSQKISAKEN